MKRETYNGFVIEQTPPPDSLIPQRPRVNRLKQPDCGWLARWISRSGASHEVRGYPDRIVSDSHRTSQKSRCGHHILISGPCSPKNVPISRHAVQRPAARPSLSVKTADIHGLRIVGTSSIIDPMRRVSTKYAQRGLLSALLLAAGLPGGNAHVYCPEVECERIKQKIAKIQSKMRQGYRASAGEKMEDELRRLRKLRSKTCR